MECPQPQHQRVPGACRESNNPNAGSAIDMLSPEHPAIEDAYRITYAEPAAQPLVNFQPSAWRYGGGQDCSPTSPTGAAGLRCR
jgi:hypothetical protein